MTDPNHDYIPPAFAEWAEQANQELTRAANEEAEQERSEQYQNTLDDFREVAKFSKDFLSILIQEGLPVALAQGIVRDNADNYSAERMRWAFRGQR